MAVSIVYKFNSKYIEQLHGLYQKEWWTNGRTLEETERGIGGSQICIGLVDENDDLQGFVRVLTDYIYKALIFDVIVSEKCRGGKFGEQLMELVLAHGDLKHVKHFELYCFSELSPFYEKFGFSTDVGGVKLMRCINS